MKINDLRKTPNTTLKFHDTKPGQLYERLDSGETYLGMEIDGQRLLLPFPKCTGIRSRLSEEGELHSLTFRLLDAAVEIK